MIKKELILNKTNTFNNVCPLNKFPNETNIDKTNIGTKKIINDLNSLLLNFEYDWKTAKIETTTPKQ